MLILSFSGVYEKETFYLDQNHTLLDLKDLSGTNSYCDDEAAKAIESAIATKSFSDIHFIDNGNYHYVSKFFLDKIRSNFSLIVFDNHSDMQPSAFGSLLSCGSWILHVIENNPYAREIYLVGISEEAKAQIPPEYADKVKVITNPNTVISPSYPVYISIDKDVFDESILKTNWDHGHMTGEEVLGYITYISVKNHILGVDICGEPEATAPDSDISKSDAVNKNLCIALTKLIP